ncbi:MAG: PAS domain S-box protein [Chloroflexota bacterium]
MADSTNSLPVEFYQLLLGATGDSIFVRDLDGNFLYVNEAAYKSRGYTKEEMFAMNLRDLDATEYARNIGKSTSELLKAGEITAESAHFRKDMSIMPVEVHARIIEVDGKKLALSVVRDISQRKSAERLIGAIIHTAIDGFWLIDNRGRFLDVNEAYCRMVGYSRAELLKLSVADVEVAERPEDTERHIKKIMETGHDRFETRHKRKDGRIIDIEISTNYVSEEGGRFFVFLRDITERKRTEVQERLQGKIFETTASSATLPRTLEAIAKSVEMELPGTLCSILLLDDEKRHLLLGAAPSLPDYYNEAINGLEIGEGQGSCGTAA